MAERTRKEEQRELGALWIQLLGLDPTCGELCDIIRDVGYLNEKAFEQLISQKPGREYLERVAQEAPIFRDRSEKILRKISKKEIIQKMIDLTK